jgi:GntR family transcriptional regulator
MEDPEVTFGTESCGGVRVDREIERVPATDELVEAFGIAAREPIMHVVTRISEDGRPVSISDTYQPADVTTQSGASVLEETITDRMPTVTHTEWLRTDPGDLVKASISGF